MVGAAGVRYYLDIGAGAACDPYKTFPLKAYHSAVLRAMIGRDKNHPCVVLWSLGNEPDTEHFPQSAYDYWHPLYEQARAQDTAGPSGHDGLLPERLYKEYHHPHDGRSLHQPLLRLV